MFLLGLNCKGYLQKCTAYSKKDNLKRSFQEVSLMEVISCYELYSFVLFHLKAVLVIVLVFVSFGFVLAAFASGVRCVGSH